MLQFKAHDFVTALSTLGELDSIALRDSAWVYDDPDRVEFLARNLDGLLVHLEAIRLRLSARKVTSTKLLLKNRSGASSKAVAELISSSLKELRERIIGELEDQTIYFVDGHEAAFLKVGDAPFGADVSDKFPEAITDIAEAAQCLGLSRDTAAVFHLMRAMETAVKKAGTVLAVTVVDKDNVDLEWGKIIANMKAPIEAMPRGEKRDEWSEILSFLYHVKQAWRNGTMHPKQTYTPDEAVSAYEAVRSFMRHLSPLV